MHDRASSADTGEQALSGAAGLHKPISLREMSRLYTMWSVKKPIESFWLVGREGMELALPSLDSALPLTEYDDTVI